MVKCPFKPYPVLAMVLLLAACATTIDAPVTTPVVDRTRSAASIPSAASHNRGYHVVEKGETLYSIAWRYGEDYKEVAVWNGIKSPHVIYPGQVIRLKPPTGATGSSTTPSTRSASPRTTTALPRSPAPADRSEPEPAPGVKTADNLNWGWPTTGQIVHLNLPTSEKGLNITGNVGQEIRAAADGEVVYSGSGLLGYGKLIIIKHNDTYLSAYAHNDRILIEEGMQVTMGQPIATMGIGNNGQPLLHFEIRKDGKPVDPNQYLPARRS